MMVMAMAIVAAMVMVMTRITKEKQQSLIFYGRARESRRDAEKSLRGIGLTRGFPARDWVRD